MFHCLQLYQWFMLILLSISTLTFRVSALPVGSYNFVYLRSCPVCKAQYDYDFTIAVQLALDNLEWSNGSRIEGDGNHINSTMESDTALPAIQATPLQVGTLC